MGGPDPEIVESIFIEARRKRSPVERAAYLDGACRGDVSLRERVEALLKAEAAAGGSFLEQPAQLGDAELGATIGPYKLLQEIGAGGFGVVYMAEQTEPVQRKVALKVIKLGMDTKQVIARFEAERQALALMDHPNIAKVLDAGATEGGRPYFVMELVKGIPITAYCDQHNLGTRARLELFSDVCGAVQHAHQKGIIHRDLKPSNVMVTLHDGKPVPKVIDFGIAKATQQRLTEKTLFTEYQQLIGTPVYMSPEQAEMSGLDIDTRTDVYSLGVLLYELLTGTTPLELEKLGAQAYGEIQRIIREQEPPKPSTRISTLGDALAEVAKQRHTDPQALSRLLRGDLDWIAMKALDKDRTRRYETAADFARDIRHHLAHEPVAAGPPSAAYRFRKFVRRHRAGVATAVLMALALLAGLAGTAYGLVRASSERDRARDAEEDATQEAAKAGAANEFLNEMLAAVDPNNAKGREVTMRFLLDEAGARLESGALRDQPEIAAAVRRTLGKTYQALVLHAPAELHLRMALETRRGLLGPEHAASIESLRDLAELLGNTGQRKRAGELFREALAIQRRTLGGDHPEVASSMENLADFLEGGGDLGKATANIVKAESMLREALAMRRRVQGPTHPDVAASMGRLATFLARSHRKDEGVTMHREALAIARQGHGDEHEAVATQTMRLAAALFMNGERKEGERLIRKVLAMRRKLLGEHRDTAEAMLVLAEILRRTGQYEESEALFRELLTLNRRWYGDTHPRVSASLGNLANMLAYKGDVAAAVPLFKEAMQIVRTRFGEEAPDLASGNLTLAGYYMDLDRDEDAEPLLEEALAFCSKRFGERNVTTLRAYGASLRFHARSGRLAQAKALFSKIKEVGRNLPFDARFKEELRRRTANQWASLGHELLDKKQPAMAEVVLRDCLAIRKELFPDDWRHFNAMSLLGGALLGQEKHAEAEPLLVAAYPGLESRADTPPIRVREAAERLVRLYTALKKPDEATEWQAKLEALEKKKD